MKSGILSGAIVAAVLGLGACAPASQPAPPPRPTEAPAAKVAEPAKPAAKDAAAPAGKELRPVTYATTAAGQTAYLVHVMEAKGISAKHGLKMEIQYMDFTEAANALKLGKTLSGTMQPTTALSLKKAGTEVRLVAPQLWSGNAWVVRKEAPYQSFKDLKGKKIGNFSRVTGAYFYSAVMAKELGLDIEKDFENVPAETGALLALLERGEVEAINMFEPHVSKLLLSGRYRVLVDFDTELQRLFGAAPLKSALAFTKETVDKDPSLARAMQAAFLEGIQVIKSGQDEDVWKAKAKELFGLNTEAEISGAVKRNRETFADQWADAFFDSQNKILRKGIELGLLPEAGELKELWVR